LQNSWDLYGYDFFVFEIIEKCETNEDVLLSREQYWLDELRASDPAIGYNLVVDVSRNAGWHHSETAKQKIGFASRGRKRRPLTEDEKEKVGERTKGKSYEELYGVAKAGQMCAWRSQPYEAKFGTETAERLKASKRGRFEDLHGDKKAAEIRRKMSETRKGKSFITDQGKESLKKSKLGKNNPMYLQVDLETKKDIIKEYQATGVVTKDMVASFGLSSYKIRRLLKESGVWQAT